MSTNFSERDAELLSAYIDGELLDAERLALEIRLDAEPELHHELSMLRQTVTLINQLPKLKAPRSFELPIAQPRPRRLPLLLTTTFSAMSAAAAILLLLFGGYLLLVPGYNAGSATSTFAPDSQSEQIAAVATLAAMPTTFDENARSMQNAPALSTTQEEAAPLADTMMQIAAPEQTESVELFSLEGEESASGTMAEQEAETADTILQFAPALTATAPIVSAAPQIAQATIAKATVEEQAAGRDAAGSPIDPLEEAAELAQSTQAPPFIPAPSADTTQTLQVDSSVVGLTAIVIGGLLLIAALFTTLARWRRRSA